MAGALREFSYKALGADGKLSRGRIEAASEDKAYDALAARGVTPLEVKAAQKARPWRQRRAKRADYQRFISQLAVLAKAGLPLLEAVEAASKGDPNPDLAERADRVRRDLRSGRGLSAAIAEHMDGLPSYAPRLIELGEKTGALAAALHDAAEQMDEDARASAEVRNALAYPAFLASAGAAAILFMFIVVVPRFASLLDSSRGEVPALSRWVLSVGMGLRDNLLAVALVAGALIVGAALAWRRADVRAAADAFARKIPLVGRFMDEQDTARWSRVAGVALKGGASLLDALALAEKSVRSAAMRQGLADARKALRSGAPIEDALRDNARADPLTVNLTRTGRLSGALDQMLLNLADIYDDAARDRAKRLTALAEPLAISVIALAAGVVVIAIVMAMTSLYDIAM